MAKKKKAKSNKWILVSVLVVLLLIAIATGAFYIYRKNTSPYTSYKVIYTETLVTNSATQYLPYSGGYMRVSHDGAEAVTSEGLRLWNVSFDMNNPIADVSGSYAAIGDLKGRILYQMDGTGSVHKTEMPYDIYEIKCSEVGVTAVRMHGEDADFIQLVDLNSEKLVEIKTLEEKDGFPVDIALSADGKKLVTSYLVIDGDEAGGWITFYNFGAVGKNYINNVTGVFKYDKVVTNLEFVSGSALCAFFDDGLKFFSVPETPSLTKEISFDSPVRYASVDGGMVAIIEDNNKDGMLSRTKVFDAGGNVVFDLSSSNEIDGVIINGKDILFYNEYACQILTKAGKVRYNGSFNGHTIEKFMPVNGKDKILMFENGQVLTIQLTKGGATE